MKNFAARALKGRPLAYQRVNELRKAAGLKRLSVKELNAMGTAELNKVIWNARQQPGGSSLFDGAGQGASNGTKTRQRSLRGAAAKDSTRAPRPRSGGSL